MNRACEKKRFAGSLLPGNFTIRYVYVALRVLKRKAEKVRTKNICIVWKLFLKKLHIFFLYNGFMYRVLETFVLSRSVKIN